MADAKIPRTRRSDVWPPRENTTIKMMTVVVFAMYAEEGWCCTTDR